jgi:uncharacterized protein YdeI (YjbR/CyaY-like superfamily)
MRRSARLSTKAPSSPAPIPARAQPKSSASSTPAKAQQKSSTKSPTAAKVTAPKKPSAKDLEIIPFPSAAAFTTWLANNPPTQGLWLKIAKKASGIPTVTYDEAIDAALCHGWIDGQRRALDQAYFLQRFTPRRKNSLWSRRNVDKVAALVAQGRMRDAGMAEVDAARADGRWERAYDGPATMEVPGDFAAALALNKTAADAFGALGKSARFPFLWRVTTARTAQTRSDKIDLFVDMLARGQTL